jgi:hypothetical protein
MIENLETYLNRKGFPMLRRCFNCKYWQPDIKGSRQEMPLGYCKIKSMIFAFTLEETVHPITRDFYLCEKHQFEKEEWLKQISQKVMLKDSIRKKDDIV